MIKKRVLFLCTGNSCRSQMAEALVNRFLGAHWEAHSAGTQPTGTVHPLAVKAMTELGVDMSHARSKSVADYHGVAFDLVVTVCDDAAENCPYWPGIGQAVHMGFPDPAAAPGNIPEKLVVFREVRDAIRQQVLTFLARDLRDATANRAG